MKKILKVIVFLLVLHLNIMHITAADFTTSISGLTGITNGGTVTLTFKATSTTNLLGLKTALTYDTNKLELISSSGSSGFNVTIGKNIVADASSGKSGTFAFATIKFKAKSDFKIGESTKVSITSVSGSDGNHTLTGTSSTLTLKMKSTDNTLEDLKINDKTITNFKKTTTSYKITVNNDVSSVKISATTTSPLATIKGTGTKNLSIYSNSFNIVVTAESGATKTYKIIVVRLDKKGLASAPSTNNTLKSLTIKDCEIDFQSDINEYQITVNNEISKLDITAIAYDAKAKVQIVNNELIVGMNEIAINVIAEDGSINKYIVKVKRNNENPQITIDQFNEISKTTTKETIEIIVNKNQVITKDQLSMIKSANKNVIFAYYESEKLIYAWHLLNSDILPTEDFDTTLEFTNDYQNMIEENTNYAEAIYFRNNNKNKSNSKLKLLVNITNPKTNLYYFDKAIKLQDDNLEINNGYIEFAYRHNNYFISRMSMNKHTTNIWPIIFGIENILIAGFCTFLLIKKHKNSHLEEKNEKNL